MMNELRVLCLACVLASIPACVSAHRETSAHSSNNATAVAVVDTKARSDAEPEKKAADWVGTLHLDDAAKAARVREIITAHLKAICAWHNEHPYTDVPSGINPVTGKRLGELDRQIIVDSALPELVHQTLMKGLRENLNARQVATILDQYTVGKVEFTMKAYREIVPNITPTEEAILRGFLDQAREEAVDYKNMKEISAIFEIYKTKCEQYLNANGRNWHELYKTYVTAAKARKAAQSQEKPAIH